MQQKDLRKRHLGLLVILALLLTFGALVQDYRFDRSTKAERTSLLAVDRTIGTLEVALSDLRGAQTGYLAAGQGPAVWSRRSTELLEQMETGLTGLRDATLASEARAHYDAATTALANLGALDRKARDQIQGDQRFQAADVISVDSSEAAERFRTELAGARSAEGLAAEARITRLSQLRLAVSAFAMTLVLVLAIYLGRPTKPTPASEAETIAQMLRELPPAVKTPVPAVRTPIPALPPPPTPLPTINLPDAAELCIDLARVMDTRDVPALLERAANVLDARGVIIWTVDPEGRILTPALTHGYPGKVLSRLGVLNVEADNVTSLSFRSMRPQMMPGTSPGAAGAIAVPLMTASGCSGVLAAEMRDGRPAPEMIAVTKILAAQFATLIGPTEAGATEARAAQA